MKPTLLILAAGVGTRYGGLKQLEQIGPNGETLIEYSIYDALNAGFEKVVVVIRSSFEKEFKRIVLDKIGDKIEIKVVIQDVYNVPGGVQTNPVRERPWGSVQALLSAKDVINEPFGIINGDDFYGKESFQLLAGQLKNLDNNKTDYVSIPYRVGNTLVDSGTVSRAVCEINSDNFLTKIVERRDVMRIDGVPSYRKDDGSWINLTDTTLVSMNMWGVTCQIFEQAEKYFNAFLIEHKNCIACECLLPSFINELLYRNKAKVRTYNTPAKWFGITYSKDLAEVSHKISELISDGVYPNKLF